MEIINIIKDYPESEVNFRFFINDFILGIKIFEQDKVNQKSKLIDTKFFTNLDFKNKFLQNFAGLKGFSNLENCLVNLCKQ